MKKFITLIIISIFFSLIGCNFIPKNTNTELSEINNTIQEQNENNFSENPTIILKRYENVDKSTLKYEIKDTNSYFYESENGLINSAATNGIKSVNYIRYYEILTSYSLPTVVNSSYINYDNAIKIIKSVLPNDIKEEYSKIDNEIPQKYIFFSSSKGQFIVALSLASYTNDNNIKTINDDIVIGISYYKTM